MKKDKQYNSACPPHPVSTTVTPYQYFIDYSVLTARKDGKDISETLREKIVKNKEKKENKKRIKKKER